MELLNSREEKRLKFGLFVDYRSEKELWKKQREKNKKELRKSSSLLDFWQCKYTKVDGQNIAI
jgi:hypothetical protein